MNRGIYPILSGALAQERQIQIFANNVANVNTAGFKQDAALFRSFLGRSGGILPAGTSDGLLGAMSGTAGVHTERVFVSSRDLMTGFEPGRLRMTGNPYDLAIQGNGFFEISTPQGLRYTRNGIFHLDGQRRLVTELGHPVMGARGELRVRDGNLQISAQGKIYVNNEEIGAIKVMDFPGQAVKKIQDGLFAGTNPKPAKDATIQSGHIEESNVNAISEMVKMMQGMRMYEAAQKLIQTFDRMAERAVEDVGRVG
ncbi:MAG TPA: flagellar hook basal-body protein [Nitrospiraceae bacterium]|nr:flagellar hook basal-body protein [Nitrospiraceae bacterium]